jgi:hypothetical protein
MENGVVVIGIVAIVAMFLRAALSWSLSKRRFDLKVDGRPKDGQKGSSSGTPSATAKREQQEPR